MARLYHIDKENGIGYEVWDGTITIAECFANVKRLFEDPDWPPVKRAYLVDLRSITTDLMIDPSMDKTIIDFCIKHALTLTNLKVAILGYDIFSKSIAFKEHIPQYPLGMMVFNSPDIASAWLGIDPAQAERMLKLLRTGLKEGKQERLGD
jgi:hypothetical protein